MNATLIYILIASVTYCDENENEGKLLATLERRSCAYKHAFSVTTQTRTKSSGIIEVVKWHMECKPIKIRNLGDFTSKVHETHSKD